jgi:two-component system, NtrC family, response regulator
MVYASDMPLEFFSGVDSVERLEMQRSQTEMRTRPADFDFQPALPISSDSRGARIAGPSHACTSSVSNASELLEFGKLMTSCKVVVSAIEKIERYARSDLSVVVTGESGTGKDLAAQLLHERSKRASQPFLPINVAALPETLAESILFGHERGAFTGANATKIGIIESARDGTVFFDEIGDLSLSIQAKLLRVLQNKTLMRVGATEERAVGARFVFATNCCLETLVLEGKFRLDLLYRIREASIELPPLRSRGSDVLLLAAHFAKQFGILAANRPMSLTQHAQQALVCYDWPGNIRELSSVIKRAAVMTDNEFIDETHLDLKPSSHAQPVQVSAAIDTQNLPAPVRLMARRRQADIAEAKAALDKFGGNISAAARELGVSRPTLYSLLRGA